MATLVYNSKGEATKVAHGIDVKDWLDNGYTLENPKEAKKQPSKASTKEEK